MGAAGPARKVMGSDCSPRSTIRSLHTGSPARAMSSSRPISAPSAISAWRRARWLPRQLWMPAPNCRCWAGVGSVDAQPVGVGAEVVGVAVGAGHAQVEHGAGRHLLARQDHGLEGDAAHELVGSVEAQQLVDGVGELGRVVAQGGQLVGRFEQVEQAVADERGGGLVAGHVQGDELGQQLLGAQAVALVGGLHQCGHDVVAGLGPLRSRSARSGRPTSRPSGPCRHRARPR